MAGKEVVWGWPEVELGGGFGIGGDKWAQLGSKAWWAKLCCISADQNVEPFGLLSFFGVSSGLVCSFPLVATSTRDDIGKVHVYLITKVSAGVPWHM